MSDNKIKTLKYFGSCEYIDKTTYTGFIYAQLNNFEVPTKI